jgi:hypothetical protein
MDTIQVLSLSRLSYTDQIRVAIILWTSMQKELRISALLSIQIKDAYPPSHL